MMKNRYKLRSILSKSLLRPKEVAHYAPAAGFNANFIHRLRSVREPSGSGERKRSLTAGFSSTGSAVSAGRFHNSNDADTGPDALPESLGGTPLLK